MGDKEFVERFYCPDCGQSYPYNKVTHDLIVTEDKISTPAYCPEHKTEVYREGELVLSFEDEISEVEKKLKDLRSEIKSLEIRMDELKIEYFEMWGHEYEESFCG